MINERICIFSDTIIKRLTADVNTFIKWQEAIGNIIHEVKMSTCDKSCEVMVVWQMCAKGDEEISIVSSSGSKDIYRVSFALENIENLTIITNDQRIANQIAALDEIVIGCELCIQKVSEDGEIEYETV